MPDETPDAPERPRLQLSGAQVAGSALAATSSAFAASTLGVAGTLIGAAVGSIVATVGSAFYTHSLRRTSETVRTVVLRGPTGTPLALATTDGRTTRTAWSDDAPDADETVAAVSGTADPADPADLAGSDLAEGHVTDDMATPATTGRWRPDRRALVAAVVAVFALTLLTLTLVEVVAGRPVGDVVSGETGTGRTTIGSVVGGSSAPQAPVEDPAPPPGEEPAAPGSEEPADQVPTDQVPTTEPTPVPDGGSAPTPAPTAPAPTVPDPAPTQAPPAVPEPAPTAP